MMSYTLRLLVCCLLFFEANSQDLQYTISKSKVSFISNAPLEVIKASTLKSTGIILLQKMMFAFSVPINTFEGFNSSLQREHFNEKYLESDQFPNATFTGKFIEDFDFSKNGIYQVRAKGVLTIHGVKQDKIIKGTVEVLDNRLILTAYFEVALTDFDINVPKVVKEKIALDIAVSVEAELIR